MVVFIKGLESWGKLHVFTKLLIIVFNADSDLKVLWYSFIFKQWKFVDNNHLFQVTSINVTYGKLGFIIFLNLDCVLCIYF